MRLVCAWYAVFGRPFCLLQTCEDADLSQVELCSDQLEDPVPGAVSRLLSDLESRDSGTVGAPPTANRFFSDADGTKDMLRMHLVGYAQRRLQYWS